MPLKNYTTKIPAVQTVGEIQGILAANGARRVMMDYGADGKVEAVTFALETGAGLRGFTLRAQPEGAMHALERQNIKVSPEQAERVAWRNVKDWIDAQIALIEAEQATMEELFLPKMVGVGGATLYELYSGGQLAIGQEGET